MELGPTKLNWTVKEEKNWVTANARTTSGKKEHHWQIQYDPLLDGLTVSHMSEKEEAKEWSQHFFRGGRGGLADEVAVLISGEQTASSSFTHQLDWNPIQDKTMTRDEMLSFREHVLKILDQIPHEHLKQLVREEYKKTPDEFLEHVRTKHGWTGGG